MRRNGGKINVFAHSAVMRLTRFRPAVVKDAAEFLERIPNAIGRVLGAKPKCRGRLERPVAIVDIVIMGFSAGINRRAIDMKPPLLSRPATITGRSRYRRRISVLEIGTTNRMLFKWLLFFPSFIHFSVGSLTPDGFKTDVKFQPPSSTVSTVSTRNRRDRRMTHWESESHSNFDDGDNNGDREQISYPTILQEPSLLQTSMDLKIAEKSSSPDFKVTRNTLTGPLTRFHNCIVDEFPIRSILSWLLFSGVKYNSGSSTNRALGQGNLMIPRCERIATQDQRIQEPVYVEEPGWIVIELNRNNLESDSRNNEREPFYVARGKRSLHKSTDESSKEEETSKNSELDKVNLLISSDLSHKASKLSRSMRKKRDAFRESLQKYLLEGDASNLLSSQFIEKSRQNAYVRPRNKHSDIFDILSEPFFISRGKKNSMGIQRSESNDGYSTALVNFQTKRQFLDAWQPNKSKKDCDPNSTSSCSQLGLKINEPLSEPFRDRRGVVEDLLKDTDPFYLSRGKRSPDTTQGYQKTTELNESAEVNKNLSIDEQH